MKKSNSRKMMVWVIVLLMCASLIATSIALVWSIIQNGTAEQTQSVDITDTQALKDLGLSDEDIQQLQDSISIEGATTTNAQGEEADGLEITQVTTQPESTPSPEITDEVQNETTSN